MSLSYCKRVNIVTVLLLCYSFTAYCQKPVNDQIDQLNNTAKKFLSKPDSLIIYADKAYDLAKQNNYPFGEGTALKLKGIYEFRKSNFDVALNYYNQSLAIFTTLGNDLELGKSNLNIATTYESKLDYINTIKYALKALPFFEKLHDDNGRARVINLLGIASNVQGQYKQANTYFFEYNTLVKKVKDSMEIASSYNNLGSTYQSLKKLDSALYYIKKSLQVNTLMGNTGGTGRNYENLAAVYLDKQDYQKTLLYALKSMAVYQSVGDKKYLSHSYFNIGRAYAKLKDTVNALNWLNKALVLAKTVGENSTISDAYTELSGIHAHTSNYKTAYEGLRAASLAKDSVINNTTTKAIEEFKTKYETEKKEHQILSLKQQTQLQTLQIEQRNTLLTAAAILILAITLIGYLIYTRRRLQAQATLQREKALQQELTVKEILNAEERERRRMGTDLHDGVGQLLSSALLSLNRLTSHTSTPQLKELADQSLALVTESYDEIRSISHQIIPNALLKHGLSTAIRDFISKIDQQSTKISLEISGITARLDEQTETILYRVIQETTTNAIKHAQASKLSIQLVKDEEGIALTIEDNGRGFDVKQLDKADGIGMKNIYSRVSFLKGTVDLQSTIGKGTLIAIFIPQG